jgi:uncharacterized membrane protein HdeD (DUF308 family)
MASGTNAARAFRSHHTSDVVTGILLAIVDIASAVTALVWPGITALALVWVVATWALIGGVGELGHAFMAGESAGQRAFLSLNGLVSIALGFVFAVRPDVGAATIAQVYGLFSIIAGTSALVMAANGDRNKQPDAPKRRATPVGVNGALGAP